MSRPIFKLDRSFAHKGIVFRSASGTTDIPAVELLPICRSELKPDKRDTILAEMSPAPGKACWYPLSVIQSQSFGFESTYTYPVAEGSWPVLNQYNTYSCVGMAIADGLFNFYAVRKRVVHKSYAQLKLNAQSQMVIATGGANVGLTIEYSPRFSPRFVWMMAKECDINGQPCSAADEGSGANLYVGLRTAFDFEQIALEERLPLFGDLYSRFVPTADSPPLSLANHASKVFAECGIRDFVMLYYRERVSSGSGMGGSSWSLPSNNTLPTVAEALAATRKWIFNLGPVAIEFCAGEEWIHYSRMNNDHPLDPTNYQNQTFPDPTILGHVIDRQDLGSLPIDMDCSQRGRFLHCATIVGYVNIATSDNPYYAYIIKNSFGPEVAGDEPWGIEGLALVSENYLRVTITKIATIHV